MENNLRGDTEKLKQLEIKLKKELKDVEKLKTISVTSLVAKIKGNKEKILAKKEEEYLSALNKKEGLEKDIAAQKVKINHQNKYIDELEQATTKLESDRNTIVQIIYKATKGVADPVEDKIIEEINSLTSQYIPVERKLDQSNRVLCYLEPVYSSLSETMQQLRSTLDNSNLGTFFGRGMVVDSIKNSKMSHARDLVFSARRNLELARNIDPTIDQIDAYIEDISFFWDGFMDNIFSDWSDRNKIQKSMESVQEALYLLNKTINNTHFELDSLNNKIAELRKKINENHSRLIVERKRIIEDAIKRQS